MGRVEDSAIASAAVDKKAAGTRRTYGLATAARTTMGTAVVILTTGITSLNVVCREKLNLLGAVVPGVGWFVSAGALVEGGVILSEKDPQAVLVTNIIPSRIAIGSGRCIFLIGERTILGTPRPFLAIFRYRGG